MELIDTHAHLNDESFADQLDGVIDRALAAGVTRMIAVGTTVASSKECVELAARYPSVYAAVGIQPNYCHEVEEGDWEQIVELAQAPRVAAIGETGLDRYWDDCPFEIQQDYFQRHIRLSRETELPFIVHMRDCEAETLEALRLAHRDGPLAGVMHSFTGTLAGAQSCLELGLYISFAGMVTFKKSSDLRDVGRAVPLDRILIETDSPYLSPEPFRGKRPNEPARVVHTAKCLADARGETLESFSQATTENALKLFRWE